MGGYQSRETRFALREIALVALAGTASFLFINHENLYFKGPFVLSSAPLEAYFLATIVIYLFLRLVIIAAEMRFPRAHGELVRCPECGQWLDDPTAAGLEAHHRIFLTSKPSEQEIVSALALRKAVDAARLGAQGSRAASRDDTPAAPIDLDDDSGPDLLAALDEPDLLDDPDFLERLRHSPNPPREPRLKR